MFDANRPQVYLPEISGGRGDPAVKSTASTSNHSRADKHVAESDCRRGKLATILACHLSVCDFAIQLVSFASGAGSAVGADSGLTGSGWRESAGGVAVSEGAGLRLASLRRRGKLFGGRIDSRFPELLELPKATQWDTARERFLGKRRGWRARTRRTRRTTRTLRSFLPPRSRSRTTWSKRRWSSWSAAAGSRWSRKTSGRPVSLRYLAPWRSGTMAWTRPPFRWSRVSVRAGCSTTITIGAPWRSLGQCGYRSRSDRW